MAGVLHGCAVDAQDLVPGLQPAVLVGGAVRDDLLEEHALEDGVCPSDENESSHLRRLVQGNVTLLIRDDL